ncbi:PREDICTED: proteinase T-like [Amphimedon queenslandica]|uniref:Peptidase S8/S53 domain-containing protein n=1 Tax=Amphimedon queenslandica TaxID=400682 RepID=A0A1X7VBC4_AMPQE|nr:PREDICTED: proteinase T-like [Amphimedon queenslandica]|eukprot:XP_003384933.2 PREDICTED: proteinase T-like [Amphimedon queenslandica]
MSLGAAAVIFILFVSANAFTARKKAPLYGSHLNTAVNGHYIVVFNEDTLDSEIKTHHEDLSLMLSYLNKTSAGTVSKFEIGSFKGYSASLEEKALEHVRQLKEVKYIEADQVVKTLDSCTEQSGATWGLVRTCSQDMSSSSYYYNPNCAGSGVDVYIIDTGIEVYHSDFDGRSEWGSDFVDSGNSPGTDLNGHGTHCAGTVMSSTWGLAKKATSVAVRVLDADGSGYVSGVVSGISWVAEQHQSRGRKSVANLSLGGGYSSTLNEAVDAAVSAGVHMVVAAGNELTDACYRSPASTQYGITVAASDSANDFAYFSNYGTCVDIIAPGVYISSTWLNGGSASLSGTSMAAPHVAGVVAKILSCTDYSPSEMKQYLQKIGAYNAVEGVPYNTPNILLYKECSN